MNVQIYNSSNIIKKVLVATFWQCFERMSYNVIMIITMISSVYIYFIFSLTVQLQLFSEHLWKRITSENRDKIDHMVLEGRLYIEYHPWDNPTNLPYQAIGSTCPLPCIAPCIQHAPLLQIQKPENRDIMLSGTNQYWTVICIILLQKKILD